MHIRCEKIKRIREKQTTPVQTKKGEKLYSKTLVIYGRDLVTITLLSEDQKTLEIKPYIQGEHTN